MKEKRDETIILRLSKTEKNRIYEKMLSMGIRSLSAYIRKMALDGYCLHLDLKELQRMAYLLQMCSNNLNQYAKRANECGKVYAADMEDLRQAMETDDRKQLRETVHRMWPLWELLQKETRLGAYRELLKDKDAACEVIRRHTESMIGEIENLIIQSGNEIRTIQSEEQDTDSGR